MTIKNPTFGNVYSVNLTAQSGGCPSQYKILLKGIDFHVKDTSACQNIPLQLNAVPVTVGNYGFKW